MHKDKPPEPHAAPHLQLVIGGSRIRRDNEILPSLRHEVAREARYPHQIDLHEPDPSYGLCYRVGRKRGLALAANQESAVYTRDIFGWITRDHKRVGALEFHEWHVLPFAEDRQFFYEMDAESHSSLGVAETILSAWELEELVGYGAILEFQLAWMAKDAARDSIWARAAEKLIQARCRRDDFSVLVLKAFPLGKH